MDSEQVSHPPPASETFEDQLHFLAKSDLFGGLLPDQLQKVVPLIEARYIKPNQTLFRAGEPASEVFVVRKGLVSVEIHLKGVTSVVDTCGPGMVVGWSALRENATYLSSARSPANAIFWAISGSQMRTLLRCEPMMGIVVYRNLAEILGRRWESLLASHALQNLRKAMPHLFAPE